MRKPLILIGHLSLLITAILAIVFYKERVLFVDPGQQLFEMINGNSYKVFVHRYSMVINQTIPLIAIKLGLPLKYVVMSYSLSFVIIFYLSFLIAVYGFKNVPAGLSIALAPIFVRMAFGHSISEAWLGVAYSAVFYAILNYYDTWRKKGILFITLFYLLIVIIVGINYFIHPVTLFTVGFAIGFTYFNKKAFKDPYIYIVGLIVVAIYLYKFLFPAHSHEERFFEGIRKADELLPKLRKLPVLEFFMIYFYKIYIGGAILLLITGIVFIKTKKFPVLLFTILFAVFYFIIACMAFYRGDAPFALESRLIPLAFILMIPFVEAIKEKKRSYVLIAGISIMMIYSFVDLTRMVNYTHTKRIRFYKQALKESEKYPEHKFYVYLPDEGPNPINSWGSAVETLLLSSLEGKENSRTIIFVKRNVDIMTGMHHWPCVFLWVEWFMFYPEDWMSKRYFNLQCTEYREMQYSQLR